MSGFANFVRTLLRRAIARGVSRGRCCCSFIGQRSHETTAVGKARAAESSRAFATRTVRCSRNAFLLVASHLWASRPRRVCAAGFLYAWPRERETLAGTLGAKNNPRPGLVQQSVHSGEFISTVPGRSLRNDLLPSRTTCFGHGDGSKDGTLRNTLEAANIGRCDCHYSSEPHGSVERAVGAPRSAGLAKRSAGLGLLASRRRATILRSAIPG